jgi:hypothetical protein
MACNEVSGLMQGGDIEAVGCKSTYQTRYISGVLHESFV